MHALFDVLAEFVRGVVVTVTAALLEVVGHSGARQPVVGGKYKADKVVDSPKKSLP